MISTRFLEWAAGFLEGEGHFGYYGKGALVTASQVQREPLERLQRILGGVIRLDTRRYDRNPKHNPVYRWDLKRGAVSLMMTLYPLMSTKRRGQIREALDRWRTLPRPGENMRRKTHCPQGHTLSGEYYKNCKRVQRFCLTCRSVRHAADERRRRVRLRLVVNDATGRLF